MLRRMLITGLVALPAVTGWAADCVPPGAPGPVPVFGMTPPEAPDPALRPALPDCLAGLDRPIEQSCSDAEIAAYGAAVDAWIAALQDHVAAADAYAAEAVRHANETVAHARAAQARADGAYDFARCETEEIRARGR